MRKGFKIPNINNLDIVSGQFHEYKFMYSEPAYCGFVRIVQEIDNRDQNVVRKKTDKNSVISKISYLFSTP